MARKKKKYQLEYLIKSSPGLLYSFLVTPSGLSQWFADFVDDKKGIYTFEWSGNEDRAAIIDRVDNEYVRFKWEHAADDEYFEFSIQRDEITGETALIIKDFAKEDEILDNKMLWDSQVKTLIQRIGG